MAGGTNGLCGSDQGQYSAIDCTGDCDNCMADYIEICASITSLIFQWLELTVA